MSIRSMTGYGRAEAKAGQWRARADISSVNRKQAEVRFSLPQQLAGREPELAAMLRGRISRGSVLCRIELAGGAAAAAAPAVNASVAAAYARKARELGRSLGLAQDLGVSALLALPGVAEYLPPKDSGASAAWPAAKKAFSSALAAFLTSRETEGRSLAADMLNRLGTIAAQTGRIAAAAPRAQAKTRRRLIRRLREAGSAGAKPDARILHEAALLAEKSDISEELVRLGSHLEQMRRKLERGAAVGRELDFLLQELNREINTAAAKAGDLGIARAAIRIKTELERLREQAQNIE